MKGRSLSSILMEPSAPSSLCFIYDWVWSVLLVRTTSSRDIFITAIFIIITEIAFSYFLFVANILLFAGITIMANLSVFAFRVNTVK